MVVKRPQLGAFFVSGRVYREKCVAGTILGLSALYGWSMLQSMPRSLCILLMLFCFSANAEIYKWVDKNGNVHFSDSETDGAQPVELPKGNIYTPPETSEVPERVEEKKQISGYTNMAIVQPELNATIRSNIGDVSVSIDLAPGLRPGDSITLYMDGKELLKNKTETTFDLSGINRGSHTLRAAVIGADGAELISSKSTIFHLHKVSVRKKTNAPTTNSETSQQNSQRNYNTGTAE